MTAINTHLRTLARFFLARIKIRPEKTTAEIR
jgi:hypothetical protein